MSVKTSEPDEAEARQAREAASALAVAGTVAVYDACVLYPCYLRDLLVRLAVADLCRAKWTDEIHDEWTRDLSANEGIPIQQLARTRRLMNAAVLDCLVTGYAERIPS